MAVDSSSSPLHLFATELRHYRNRTGWTQDQLADEIGYSAALVGWWRRHGVCHSGISRSAATVR
jgi:Helix-turn-helix domain